MSNCCNYYTKEIIKTENLLRPINHGEEQCKPNHYWGAGVRANYLIHYVISGTGVYYVGANKFTLKQGQIFVIFPGSIVKYQADSKNPWRYTWIEFSGTEASEVFTKLGITYHNPVYTVANSTALLSVLRSMPTERNANLCENFNFSAKLYEFMSILAEETNNDEKTENLYLTTATRYIKAHYTEDVTVAQIAEYIGISRKYLFAIFKNALNVSPKDYIIDYRVKKACEFLKDKTLPIGNVAYSVGYKDPLTFSKMFKLKTGVSPTEYREKN